MGRGRHKLADPRITRKIQVPKSLDIELNAFLEDPITGRPVWGMRSTITVQLLREYLRKQKLNIPDDTTMQAILKAKKLKNENGLQTILLLLERLGYKKTAQMYASLYSDHSKL